MALVASKKDSISQVRPDMAVPQESGIAHGYHGPMGGGSHIPGEHGKLVPGQAIGAYVLVRELGRGGMGVVWLARDERLNRMVAIKTLHVGHGAGLGGKGAAQDQVRAKLRDRALGEARALAAIEHPNIASVFDVVESESGAGGGSAGGGTVFVVMEYVPGESLADRIRRSVSGGSSGLRVQEAVSIAAQVAEALAAAHAKGLLHRDLKPSNIQLTPEGVAKVLDFGLSSSSSRVQRDAVPGVARPDGETAEWMVSDRRDGEAGDTSSVKRAVSGTPAYMSPEQQTGEELDARSDMYAFGCVLYEMLTGQIAQRVLPDGRRGVHVEPMWDMGKIHGQASGVPETVRTLVSGCLRSPKHERMRSAADAAVILRGVLDESRAGVRSSQSPSRATWKHWVVSHGGVFVLAVIAAMILTRYVALPYLIEPFEAIHSWYARNAKMPAAADQRAWTDDLLIVAFGGGNDAAETAAILGIDGVKREERQSWRRVHAAMIEKFAKAQARCIALDITFATAANPEDSKAMAAAISHAKEVELVPVIIGIKTWHRDEFGVPTDVDPQLLESGVRRGMTLVDPDERTKLWSIELGLQRQGITQGNTSFSLETYLATLQRTANSTLEIENGKVWVNLWRTKPGSKVSERAPAAKRLPINASRVFTVDQAFISKEDAAGKLGYQIGDVVAEVMAPFDRSKLPTEEPTSYEKLARLSDAEFSKLVSDKIVVVGDPTQDIISAPDGEPIFGLYSHLAGLGVLMSGKWVEEVPERWLLIIVMTSAMIGVSCTYFGKQRWKGVAIFCAAAAAIVLCCLWMPRMASVWINPIPLVVALAFGSVVGFVAAMLRTKSKKEVAS